MPLSSHHSCSMSTVSGAISRYLEVTPEEIMAKSAGQVGHLAFHEVVGILCEPTDRQPFSLWDFHEAAVKCHICVGCHRYEASGGAKGASLEPQNQGHRSTLQEDY